MNPREDDQVKQSSSPHHRKKRLYLAGIILVLVILGSLFIFLKNYYSRDHSIYSVLSSETYNLGNFQVNFKYPAVMSVNKTLENSLNKGGTTPLVFSYKISSKQNINMALNFLPLQQTLHSLKLDPHQLISQIQNDSGSYITQINSQSTSLYSKIYGSCQQTLVNVNQETSLVCVDENNGITTFKVIGINQFFQASLIFAMPDNVWNDHQRVWAQVEKNFTY